MIDFDPNMEYKTTHCTNTSTSSLSQKQNEARRNLARDVISTACCLAGIKI